MFTVAVLILAKQYKQPVSNNRRLNYGASSWSVKNYVGKIIQLAVYSLYVGE